MTPRHTAALALVGWYLMKPPLYVPWMDRVRCFFGAPTCLDWEYDYDAPVSNWTQVGEFESLADCHAEQDRIAEQAAASLSNDDPQWKKTDAANSNLICIATDDPRLKGN
jgi:hypothetical protein